MTKEEFRDILDKDFFNETNEEVIEEKDTEAFLKDVEKAVKKDVAEKGLTGDICIYINAINKLYIIIQVYFTT